MEEGEIDTQDIRGILAPDTQDDLNASSYCSVHRDLDQRDQLKLAVAIMFVVFEALNVKEENRGNFRSQSTATY